MMMMMMTYKLRLQQNKFKILITALFVLGIYHLLIFGLKWNVFNMPKDQLTEIKQVLYRFYHLSENIIICLGFLYQWKKIVLWILPYFGFKIVYNLLLFITSVKETLHSSLSDGVSFGILIIIILMLIRCEENR